MKPIRLLALSSAIAVASVGLVACGSDKPEPESQGTFKTASAAPAADDKDTGRDAEDSKKSEESETSSRSRERERDRDRDSGQDRDGTDLENNASDVFNDVIDDADAWANDSQDADFSPSGEIGYYYADINGDGEDDLLLARFGTPLAPVTVVRNEDGTPVKNDGYVIIRPAGGADVEVQIYASKSGRGVWQVMEDPDNRGSWKAERFEIFDGVYENTETIDIEPGEILDDFETVHWRNAATSRLME